MKRKPCSKNQWIKEKTKYKTYHVMRKTYPELAQLLLQGLLSLDGYSEIEIGFGAGIRLDSLRKILLGNQKELSQKNFYRILGLYARVFCDWSQTVEPKN